MPSPGPSSAAPAAIRPQVRDAVRRAWDAAVAAGALPAVGAEAEAPAVGIERPSNPAFGDFATNLAMQLARPLRRSPLDIAGALAEALRGGPDAGLFASIEVARPGFVNLRLADAAFEATRRRHPRGARMHGAASRASQAASRQRRVRVGEPHRAR